MNYYIRCIHKQLYQWPLDNIRNLLNITDVAYDKLTTKNQFLNNILHCRKKSRLKIEKLASDNKTF